MKCLITKIETNNTYETVPISKQVVDFAKWYRDKLNVEQKQKAATAKAKLTNLVDLRTCLKMFFTMKNKGYSWEKIKSTLKDELLLKGLLTEKEYSDENDKTEI